MPVKSRWVSYKSYSGYVSSGGPKIEQPVNAALHVDRAVYLAGLLEAGSWGTVQGYDGCAMSGGLLHNIAVSPRDLTQGTFFALLREVSARAKLAFSEVGDEFLRVGWKVTPDGKLRSVETGALVGGRAIRKELSGSEAGNVAKAGVDSNRAKLWAERFFRLFTDSTTFAAQSDYAAAWLAEGNRGTELEVYRFFLGPNYATLDSIVGIRSAFLPPEVELAMCVYHAFSVNAPGIAKAVLEPIVTRNLRGFSPTPAIAARFSGQLIRTLGKRQYGNWLDAPGDGSNRYDKTRLAIWSRPDLWDAKLAKSTMPRDLSV